MRCKLLEEAKIKLQEEKEGMHGSSPSRPHRGSKAECMYIYSSTPDTMSYRL